MTPKKGWTVGSSGTILYTGDGGVKWSFQESGTEADLSDVVFLNEKVGWAVGREGTILSRRDGGLIREKQGDVKIHVTGVFFLDEKRVGPEKRGRCPLREGWEEELVGNEFYRDQEDEIHR